MNSIFNIHRFGLLLRKELTEKYFSIIMSIIYSLLAYLFVWGMTILYDTSMPVQIRGDIMLFIFILFVFFAPYAVYKNENKRLAGTFYAIMPVSTLEKLLSVITICTILMPAVLFVCLYSMDSLLTLIHFGRGGFSGNVWPMVNRAVTYTSSSSDFMEKIIQPNLYLHAFSYSSVAVCLCFLFRKNKIGYSILLNFGIGMFCMLLLVGALSMPAPLLNLDISEEDFIHIVNGFVIFSTYILPVVLYILTYFRIKRIQY